jgi:hypothetical protein
MLHIQFVLMNRLRKNNFRMIMEVKFL